MPLDGRIRLANRLHDPPSADANGNVAVKELNELLDAPEGMGAHVPGFVFQENTVLLMDNARSCTPRMDIKDPKRWLRHLTDVALSAMSSSRRLLEVL